MADGGYSPKYLERSVLGRPYPASCIAGVRSGGVGSSSNFVLASLPRGRVSVQAVRDTKGEISMSEENKALRRASDGRYLFQDAFDVYLACHGDTLDEPVVA